MEPLKKKARTCKGDDGKAAKLERELVRAEDKTNFPGMTISPTLYAAKNGHTTMLAERLSRGADPNQEDGYGGTCLVATASFAKPECTRLLIDAGADVTYIYPGDNASILYQLVYEVKDLSEHYRPGDYVLAADLLVEAGAPIDTVHRFHRRTALDMLRSMEVKEDSKEGHERHGLIAVLERRYWKEHGSNPFVSASADEATWLLLNGAANNDTGHVDITKVRCIKPSLRQSVLDELIHFEEARKAFVNILLTMKHGTAASPFHLLRGHESTILPIIAAYAGATGWQVATLEESIVALEEAINIFNVDFSVGAPNESDDEGESDDNEDEEEDELEVDE